MIYGGLPQVAQFSVERQKTEWSSFQCNLMMGFADRGLYRSDLENEFFCPLLDTFRYLLNQ